MTYRERTSAIPGAVAWSRVADGAERWILPDGCIDVIWDGTSLFVAGPDTGPHRTAAPVGTAYAALRFGPGTAPAVLGVPADALRDQRVALGELWPRAEVEPVVARLHDAHAGTPTEVLEQVVADRLRGSPVDPLAAEVARRLGEGQPVAEVAAAVGLGERQLHRRSLALFGYGPKVLARVQRLQRALALARGGSPLSAAAAEAGYADQAHLAREVRALAGTTMGQLAADEPR